MISNINSLCFYLFNKLLYKSTKFLKNYTISKIIQKNYGGTSPTFTPSDILTSNDLDSSASTRYHLIIELALKTLLV